MKSHRLALLLCTPLLLGVGISPRLVNASVGNYSTESGTYYNSIEASGGVELLGELHDLLVTTHKTYTTYDDCKTPSYVALTDTDFQGEVLEFYSQTTISKAWGSGKQGSWNREHVWCQSLSNGLWGESGGGADLHHIRPVESGLNSARNNAKFGEVPHTPANEKYYEDATNDPVALGGYALGQEVFEPIDDSKGDVARIIFYVYTHYNTYKNVGGSTNGTHSTPKFGTLDFSDVVDGSDEEAIDLLLAWNELDPVSEYEMARNEEVAKYQGNRNPFIDHPEYAEYIWGEDFEPSLSAPSSLTMTVGETKQLGAVIHGGTGTISYSSSDEAVVAVAADGSLTALTAGEATIECRALVEGKELTASTQISVKSPSLEGRYKKLTAIPEDIDGKYVITYNDLALNSSLEASIDQKGNFIEIQTDGDCITSDVSSVYFTFESDDNDSSRFYLRTPEGRYVYSSSTAKNQIAVSSSVSSACYLNIVGNDIVLFSDNGSALRYNSGDTWFRFYKPDTYTKQKAISLYKLTEDENVSSAKAFASNFLNSIQCDNGVTPPSASAWKNMAQEAAALSSAALSILQTASYQDGDIGLAVERYDFILRKYGTTAYPDFLGRGIRPLQSSKVIEPIASESFMIFGSIVLIFIGSITIYVLLRRKHS